MEVTNIFNGLNLIDRVPEELWTEEPGGLQPRESERVGQRKQFSRHAHKGFYSSLFPPSSLNQINYDYTVEVRNRFKGLDLIGRVPEELWTDVSDIVQETGIKTIPKKKKCKNAKWLFEEALQVAV